MEGPHYSALDLKDELTSGGCHLKFKLEAGIYSEEPSSYILAYEGSVFAGAEQSTEVGELSAFVVDIERAVSDFVNPWDVLDSYSASLAHHTTLVRARRGTFTSRVQDEVGYEIGPVLVLDYLKLKGPFRGQGIGLEAIKIACDRLGLGCCLASLRAFPTQWEGRVADDPRAFRRDRTKLMRHYERAGFRSIGRDGLMVRAL